MKWLKEFKRDDAVNHLKICIFFFAILLLWVPVTKASDFAAMTAPFPPFSINKGLHVNGIAVDTLAVIMSLSGSPMSTDDVKLMLWNHGLQITAKGPNKIMLNVPKTDQTTDMFKWVGPIDVSRFAVISRKDGKKITSIEELNGRKISTIRNSMAERALLASGVEKKRLKQSVTHVIPLKQLKMKMVDYFVHTDSAATYLMNSMDMKLDKYTVQLIFLEVPIYYAFSKDTRDSFINRLNENLVKLKKPGKDGLSRYDKIVAKYLPQGVLQ